MNPEIPKNTESYISTTYCPSDKEGNHFVLVTLPFIWGQWPYSIQLEWDFLVTYKLLRVWVFPFISLNRTESIFSTSFIGSILPSSRFSMAWPLNLRIYLSSPGVMSRSLQILRFWKTSILQDLVKIYSLRFSYPGVVQRQGIQIRTLPYLACKARWMVQRSHSRAHMCYSCFCTILAKNVTYSFLFIVLLYYCIRRCLVPYEFGRILVFY